MPLTDQQKIAVIQGAVKRAHAKNALPPSPAPVPPVAQTHPAAIGDKPHFSYVSPALIDRSLASQPVPSRA